MLGWTRRLLAVLCLLGGPGVLFTLSIRAQDSAPIFATNTPRPPAPVMTTPDAPFDFYALRDWFEVDFVDALFRAVGQLTPGDSETQQAIRLLQYEMERKYPGAPHNFDLRERLLGVMLGAPRGSIDLRRVIRPYIQTILNQRVVGQIEFLSEYKNFRIEVIPANVDGIGATDAIIHIRYPAAIARPNDILYEDYTLAQVDASGLYRILEATPDFPAAPFNDIASIVLERQGDLTKDTLDEIALSLQTTALNRQLMIFGWRNDRVISLVQPGEKIEFGSLLDWPLDSLTFSLYRYRIESPEWRCIGQLAVNWEYISNYFRPVVDPNADYVHQDTLACRLYEAEPLFEQPPADAIAVIENILARSGRDEPGAQYAFDRAQMALAMLYALDGQPTRAMETAQELQARAQPDSWLAGQSEIFLQTLTSPGATALSLCEALLLDDDHGACNMDQVLGRLFAEQPLTRGEPVVAQLESRGLPVLETVTLSTIGRADRTAVNFNLFGASWWAFGPLNAPVYMAEIVDPPTGFEEAALPQGLITAPPPAYDALFVDDDPQGALNVLDNAIRDNPGVPLSPSARYLQALCYDLMANRASARRTYFDLWREYSSTIWGQLAAAHLERR